MTPSVVWQPPATDTFNVTETPDLSDLLQSVVSLQGWKSGNAVTLLMDGEGEANDIDERVYFGSAISFTEHRATLRVRFCRPPPPEAIEATIVPVCPPAGGCEACPGAAAATAMRTDSASGGGIAGGLLRARELLHRPKAGMVVMADAAPQQGTPAEETPRFALSTTFVLAGAALSLAAFVGCTAGFVRRQRGSCSLEDELDACLEVQGGVDRACCGGGDSGL